MSRLAQIVSLWYSPLVRGFQRRHQQPSGFGPQFNQKPWQSGHTKIHVGVGREAGLELTNVPIIIVGSEIIIISELTEILDGMGERSKKKHNGLVPI